MEKFRNFVFTCNNYSLEELEALKSLKNLKYLILGYEKVHTDHLQGYCELSNGIRFKTLKKILPRFHIEKRHGTALQASDYCKKEGNFEEIGEISKPGKRNDIIRVKEAVESGQNFRTIVSDIATNYQTLRIAEKLLPIFEPHRTEKPYVRWFYGKTGSGKSHAANELFPNAYRKAPGKWWCGYDAHEDVIIDDFRSCDIPFNQMLQLLDKYGYRVEIKGGSRQFLAKNIVVTTPKSPEKTYDDFENLEQLTRRIDEVKLFKGSPCPSTPGRDKAKP